MKQSLLDMVQDILSDMNDDNVSTISETIEGLQVAQIVKSVFFEMIGNKNWPHLKKLSALTASGDAAKPTHMLLGEGVKELLSVEYDDSVNSSPTINFKPVNYVTPDEFLRTTNNYNKDQTNTVVVEDYSGVKFNIKNNHYPRCYTSFDDQYIVFDSFDAVKDDTLQESKNRIYVVENPEWSMVDNFVPDLPEEAFPALLAEAKSTAFARIKQAPDSKSEQQSKRQRAWLSRKAFQVDGGIKLPDYGKKR